MWSAHYSGEESILNLSYSLYKDLTLKQAYPEWYISSTKFIISW